MNTKNHQIRIVIYIIIGAVIAAAGVFLVLHSNNSRSSISLQDNPISEDEINELKEKLPNLY